MSPAKKTRKPAAKKPAVRKAKRYVATVEIQNAAGGKWQPGDTVPKEIAENPKDRWLLEQGMIEVKS